MRQPARVKISLIVGLALLLCGAGVAVVSAGGPGVFLPLVSRDYQICATPPKPRYPSGGAILGTLAPEFLGDAGKDYAGQYVLLQVATDPDFKRVTRTLTSSSPRGTFSAQSPGNFERAVTYYWRAQLVCDQRASPYSEVLSFSTPSLVELPGAGDLSSPDDGALQVSRALTLHWQPVPGALDYLVYFRANGPHGWLMARTEEPNLARRWNPDTTYEWYVVARSATGFGPESEHRTFSTTP